VSVVFEVVVVFLVIVSILPEVSTFLIDDESTFIEVADESTGVFDLSPSPQEAMVTERAKAAKPNLNEFFIFLSFNDEF